MDSATSQALPTQATMGITQAVLLEIIVHGPVARSTIAQRIGRSQARVSRVVAPLIKSGLVHETTPEQPDESFGRPLVPLTINADALFFLGIKLTAERAWAVVTDLSGATRAEWDQALLDSAEGEVVDLIATLLHRAETEFGAIEAIGITLGGHTVDQRLIRHASFLGWDDVPLADLVEQRTGKPTAIENDVRALTLDEHWFGSGRGRASFAIITLGAGLALGIVSGNAVVTGATSFAGAIGHHRVIGSEATCEFGHVGCARALLTTAFIEQHASDAIGHPISFEELVTLADAGDEAARAVLQPAGTALGQIIGTIVNVLDPGLIIISGESAPLARVAAEEVRAGTAAVLHWAANPPEVVVAGFDFVEWARGAAIVAMRTVLLGGTLPDLLERLAPPLTSGVVTSSGAQLHAIN